MSTRSVIKVFVAVFLFFLGSALLCHRFSDWIWLAVIVLGFVLFIDGELGLIAGKNKISVFKNSKKLTVFVLGTFAGVGLMIIIYMATLLILFPPI